MTAIPKATAVLCTMSPVHKPNMTAIPALLPCKADCVSTNILSGSGARPSRTDAVKNVINVSMGIIEVIGMTKRFVEGITVTRETVARQIIEDVGPGGHFLVQQHTTDHFKKELWTANLLNRENIEAWNAAGKPSMEDRVREEVRMIAETHKPEPLSDKVMSELERLKKEGEKEILAKLAKG